jgi:hypothetical protein
VWLVIALDVIREAVQKLGKPVGPVVVLSYKNHALDEFVGDLVGLCPSLKLKPGSLIRSGKSDDESLAIFCERNSPGERQAHREVVDRLSVLRQSSRVERDWADLAVYLEQLDMSASILDQLEQWESLQSKENGRITWLDVVMRAVSMWLCEDYFEDEDKELDDTASFRILERCDTPPPHTHTCTHHWGGGDKDRPTCCRKHAASCHACAGCHRRHHHHLLHHCLTTPTHRASSSVILALISRHFWIAIVAVLLIA